MEKSWGTCGDDGAWCGFLTLDIDDAFFDNKEGVYIIWKRRGPIFKIGRGNIKNGITECRRHSDFAAASDLMVTWVVLPGDQINGVANYLEQRLKPQLKSDTTTDAPIEVNLPWSSK